MKLIVICGATATGKSRLAMFLAEKLQTGILNADSRQVYQEFDIGTAKPSQSDRTQIPHYLIDIWDPRETMTMADYQDQAQEIVTHYQRQELIPLLVGGTGLYIKAITQGMKIPRVAPQPELRSQLASISQTQLYQMLAQVDPLATQKIHPNDAVRTLRALEVFYVTGIPISAQQGENPPSYAILTIGLDTSWQVLEARIRQRTQQMLDMGWLAEVEYLTKKYGADLPLLNTLGYQEMGQYLQGKIGKQEAIEQTILHTRQFAKRQKTWFRSRPEINWFDSEEKELFPKVWQQVLNFLQ